MALYVLGDPHLSFSCDKPMDIFGARWENHSEKIKKAWLTQVRPEDTVLLAGDLSWAISLKEAETDLRFFHDLPGRKILLKGNHDYWWETASKMHRFFEERGWDDFEILYNNALTADGFILCGTRGWEPEPEGEQERKILARELQRLELSLKAAPAEGERIAFLHFPPADDFIALLKKYGVRRCYYGHIHGPAARQAQPVVRDGVLCTLISADALDFSPLLIENGQNCQKQRSFWSKLLSYFKSKC